MHGYTRLERLQEQLKDAYGRVYLPGSTIKGALRNALMTYAATLSHSTLTCSTVIRNMLVNNGKSRIFGDLPQHEFAARLQASDSVALPLKPSPLEVLPVQVFTQASDEKGSPIAVEAVSKGVFFETSLTIDELSLQYADDYRLHWGDRVAWLLNLLPILQAVSLRRIEQELQEIQARGFDQAAAFYADLQTQAGQLQGTNSALLQLGWGTGWMGMTIASALDQHTRNHLRQKFLLGKPPTWNKREKGDWEPILTKPYPKSRRLKAIQSGATSLADLPLGWVKLAIEPVGAPTLPEKWEKLSQQALKSFLPLGEYASVDKLPLSAAPVGEQTYEVPVLEPLIPPPPVPVKIVQRFSDLPEIGDGFDGISYMEEKGEIWLEIPGLDPDLLASAILKRSENLWLGEFEDGKTIPCVVIEIEPDPAQENCFRVICRMTEEAGQP